VQHLIDNFHLSKSGAYYHFKTKPKWIGQYQHAKDDNNRIGYARTRIDVLCKILEFSLLSNSGKTTGASSERAEKIKSCLKDKDRLERLPSPEEHNFLNVLANKLVVEDAVNAVT